MKKKEKHSFGIKGWWTIIFCGLLYYMMTGTSADGLNVMVPGFCELKGWDYSTLLSFSTIAGLVGMIIAFLTARLITKKGAKFVIVLSCIIAGAAFILYGYSSSMAMYLVTICFACGFAYVYSFQATGPVIAKWFPRKRGIVMGYVTAFMPLASATFLYLLNWLIATFGFQNGIAITGIMTIVLGIIGMFSIKNTPEEAGMLPDNMPMTEEAKKALKEESENYVSPWTAKKLLKNKVVWCIACAYGFMMLANTGVISQLVPRITEDKGYTAGMATVMFSVASLCGIVLSIAWGWLDTKIGTKKASFVMLIWFIISVVMNLIPNNTITLWISIVMIGGDLGGTANFLVSMTTRIFGRRDFDAAYGIIYPIFSVIRTMAFAFVGFFTKYVNDIFGQKYAGAYIGLIIACVISMIFVSQIDYDKFLGHDILRETE